jgi:hypothetical protein
MFNEGTDWLPATAHPIDLKVQEVCKQRKEIALLPLLSRVFFSFVKHSHPTPLCLLLPLPSTLHYLGERQ